jgi:dCTP deaminase
VILSNEELFAALDSGRLAITPQPTPRRATIGATDDYCPFDTHAVDLRLGTEITVPEPGTYAYDLMQKSPLASFIERNSRRHSIDVRSHFVLERQQFVLAQTLETVSLPIVHPKNQESGICLAARIEGKSSRARVGLLIHFTAPTVHPGWSGKLTLEMINLGPARILLTPGMPIAQLIVEEVRGLPSANPSQFQNQATPAGVGPSTPPEQPAAGT